MENISFGKMQNENFQKVVDIVKDKITAYEIEVNPVTLVFHYFRSDNPLMDEKFDELRKELVPMGFIPFLRENGENVLVVAMSQKTNFMGNKVNIVLFVLTLASTIYWGSIYAANFTNSETTSLIFGFLFFSAPLMLILGLHELGHYFVAKKLKVKASFPFFIPFPLYLGTFGAFISLRDPIPNRKAMIEIGAAGPIVGFLACIPLLFAANYLQYLFPVVNNNVILRINFPLIYNLFGIGPATSPVFPMILAVWVGFLATAMNLLPLSQLDGGHIARGLLGRRSNLLGYAVTAVLFFIGLKYYAGWMFLGIFGIFMGLSHPPPLDDYAKISTRHILIAVAVLVMFLVSFTIKPII
ncbi:MAG: site-2 protease family protein [Thermoplasmataceae archaeon]